MKTTRLYTLLSLLLMVFGNEAFGQSQKSRAMEETILTAKQAYNSADFPTANASYLALDSADSIVYYYDLWQFYVSAEKVKDTIKSKELLFRLVENKGFERFTLN